MYRLADKLLEQLKKLIRREFNRLGVMGFDELNVLRVTNETTELFERLMAENLIRYLKVAQQASKDARALVLAAGYEDKEIVIPNEAWVRAFLQSYNYVSGYLYEQEAERKRLRLAEQMMTAAEYQSRTLYNDSLKRSANLWWTQSSHYMLDVVDVAVLYVFKLMGVKRVQWVTNIDGRECQTCRERHGEIYDIGKVPPKAHRGCRCTWKPVPKK